VGQRVFVRLNGNTNMRPAILVGLDRLAHPLHPWQVVPVQGFSVWANLPPATAKRYWVSDAAGFAGVSGSDAGRLGGEGLLERFGDGVIVGLSPRSGFDNLIQSFVSVFQILGGSGWPDFMTEVFLDFSFP
jgi:hypothetical protein